VNRSEIGLVVYRSLYLVDLECVMEARNKYWYPTWLDWSCNSIASSLDKQRQSIWRINWSPKQLIQLLLTKPSDSEYPVPVHPIPKDGDGDVLGI